jgi:predicted small lipoprotein YifL
VIDISDQRWARIAAVAAIAAALGLSACGRKGPLDPPPYASAHQGEPGQPAPAGRAEPQMGIGPDGKAAAPVRARDNPPFILDWLVE